MQDEFAYVVLGQLNSQIFLLDIGLVKGYTKESLTSLALVAREFKLNCFYYESNFGDEMFASLFSPYLRKYHPCPIEPIRNNKQKELRIIETLEPAMNQHKIIVSKGLIEKDVELCKQYTPELRSVYSLFYQLTHITKDKGCLGHDDRLDAFAGGVAQLNSSMMLDVDEEIKHREQEEFEKTINEYLEEAGLDPHKKELWWE